MSRQYTCMLLEMIEGGALDRDLVINAFTSYMSEADVHEMMRLNEFILPEVWCDEDGSMGVDWNANE